MKKARFSKQEDLAILQGVAEEGNCWARIIQKFPVLKNAGRSNRSIQQRFSHLASKEPEAEKIPKLPKIDRESKLKGKGEGKGRGRRGRSRKKCRRAKEFINSAREMDKEKKRGGSQG